MSLVRALRRFSEKVGSLFSDHLGVDLGTANTLVYSRGRGIVLNEPTVVALNQKTGAIVAVGAAAERMLGKAPPHITVLRPLAGGAIAHFEVTEQFLRYFMQKARERSRALRPPRVVIGVPASATDLQRRAAVEVGKNAGAGEVFLVETPVAAALGLRLPVREAEGMLVLDIGGGTAEIAVLSFGSIVLAETLATAGSRWDADLIEFAREHYQLFIGERTAEEMKCTIGAAKPFHEPVRFVMRGRHILTGLPREISVGDEEIRRALAPSVAHIVTVLKGVLEKTPPELVADILNRGIYLVGGGSLLPGLDELIAEETKVVVHRADEPLTAVARGAGIIVEDFERYRGVLKHA